MIRDFAPIRERIELAESRLDASPAFLDPASHAAGATRARSTSALRAWKEKCVAGFATCAQLPARREGRDHLGARRAGSHSRTRPASTGRCALRDAARRAQCDPSRHQHDWRQPDARSTAQRGCRAGTSLFDLLLERGSLLHEIARRTCSAGARARSSRKTAPGLDALARRSGSGRLASRAVAADRADHPTDEYYLRAFEPTSASLPRPRARAREP